MGERERSVYSTFGMPRTLLIALLFIGILSIISLYLGFDAYLSDKQAKASLYLLLGTGGFALIGYMFFRSKTIMEKVEMIPQLEVVTTLECPSCGLKNIRPFQRGDYVFKEADECSRCKGKAIIAKIHGRERQKPK